MRSIRFYRDDVKRMIYLYKNTEGETKRIVLDHPRNSNKMSHDQLYEFFEEIAINQEEDFYLDQVVVETKFFIYPGRSIFEESRY